MDKNKRKHRLLIADTNPDSAMFFDVNLSRFGYEILAANSSEEALQLASSSTPSVIIAQLSLKPQDGIEFCWMLRQAKYLRIVPFVLLTGAKRDEEIELRAFRNGVDAVLPYPVSLRTLVGRVESLLWRFDQLMQTDKATTDLLYSDYDADELPVIQANLKNFNLLEALQFFNMNKKSGRLTVRKDDETGTLILEGGEVIFAETGGYTGEEATYRLVIWHEGVLSFYHNIGEFERNIDKPTMKLILDCCTVLDMESFVIKS